jgi:hypothetical protein
MTAVANPFPLFSDTQARLIDNGQVFIGAPDMDPQTSPKAAFWDAARTIPATQPLQTIAGYIVNAGAPAVPYVDGDYSIRVRQNDGTQVYYRARVSNDATQVSASLPLLKEADIIGGVRFYDGSWWFWAAGDYTGKADDIDIVKANSTALTTGAWVRQLAGSTIARQSTSAPYIPADRLFGRTQFADDWTRASHDSDADTIIEALADVAAGNTQGKGKLQLLGRDYTLGQTVFVPSLTALEGVGAESVLIFDGVDPATITGSGSSPRWGNLRTTALCMAGTNPDDMAGGTYSDGHTGDYPIADLRAFAAATTLAEGATQFSVPAGTANDVAAGDFIRVEKWVIGWHYAVHEIAQVADKIGDTINLTKPLRYAYTNASGDAGNDFMELFAYAGGPPPGVLSGTFFARRQSGWRRVAPCEGASVRKLAIRNVNTWPQYANLSLGIFRGFKCSAEDIWCQGGGVWNLDSDNTTFTNLRMDRIDSAYAQTDFLPANGSTNTRITNPYLKGGNTDLEEGTCDLEINGGTFFGHIFVNYFNRDVRIRDVSVTLNSGYALRIDRSANVSAHGDFVSPQPAVQSGSEDFFSLYPGATLAHWLAVGGYWDGAGVRLMPGSYAYSTANNGLDIYTEQTMIADGAEVGGPFGDVVDVDSAAATYVVGTLRRRQDGMQAGSPAVTAKPTFFPAHPAQEVRDTTTGKLWRQVNRNAKTAVATALTSTTFTVNANTTNGGVAVGDVAKVLIENTASVTINAVVYTSGNARKWHYSAVQAIDTGSGLVTITTAVPANWSVKTGANGIQYFARWG